ncbi:uncharacterized protein PHALS_15126 [Plasmopara halstedii]|uniref:Uncharacterized protein n=1 Tax=Plasmopara halstedii TaxID=4781 RepID=A0A0N7L473_PLAHL|nr:uncharacterized protein PHALS_15126 [Plasmopara halstedii]CEG37875.1 hypothetical protein PHALS_15126 [Plasmopara halstedii]|eukprot:XP_024574244.1 hypothetical protein PHALS_15126 [Plasmopara halstedii]
MRPKTTAVDRRFEEECWREKRALCGALYNKRFVFIYSISLRIRNSIKSGNAEGSTFWVAARREHLPIDPLRNLEWEFSFALLYSSIVKS